MRIKHGILVPMIIIHFQDRLAGPSTHTFDFIDARGEAEQVIVYSRFN